MKTHSKQTAVKRKPKRSGDQVYEHVKIPRRSVNPLPAVLRRTFRYNVMQTITNAATVYANQTFVLSNPQNFLGSATNIPGWNAMYSSTGDAYYSAYRVLGADIRAEFANLDATTAPRVGLCISTDTVAANTLTSDTLQDQYLTQRHAKHQMLGISTGASRGRVDVSFSLRQTFGVIERGVTDGYATYLGLSGTTVAATNVVNLIIMLKSVTNNLTTGVSFSLMVDFDVEFFQRTSESN